MHEYTVTVYCTIRETYSVMADSAEDAADMWHEGELIESENQSVDNVTVKEDL